MNNPIDSAVLRKAKNIPVGALVCFRLQWANYTVVDVEHRSEPFPQVVHYHGNDGLQSNSYSPDDRLYVILPS